MANTRYENIVIQEMLDELLTTKLDMSQFLTVDTSLQESAGMTKNVHVYSSTGAGETVAEGKGNTSEITMSYTNKPYKVTTYQARFVYTDEDAMTDPYLVDAGIQNLAKDIVNEYNKLAVTEFAKATKSVTATAFNFDAFADALATLNLEDADEASYFALVSVADRAELRKNMKEELKYVEDNARTGYIGTICGVPVYTSKAVTSGTIYIASPEAVTAFMKKGTEVEQAREENTRTNTVYGRNVKVIALTDTDKVVKITKAESDESGQ